MYTYSLDSCDTLATLQLKRFSQAFTLIPAALFPEEEIQALYSALNVDQESAPNPFTVSAYENGAFKRLYVPTVMSNSEEEVVVKLGSDLIPISDSSAINFMSFNTSVVMSLTNNQKTVILPILFKEGTTVSAVELNKKPKSLVKYLALAKVGGGTISEGTLKLTDLPVNSSYFIHGYTVFKGDSYNTLYMRCFLTEDLNDVKIYDSEKKETVTTSIKKGKQITIRGNNKLLTLFNAKPIVTEECPALLTVVDHVVIMGKNSAIVKIELGDLEEF